MWLGLLSLWQNQALEGWMQNLMGLFLLSCAQQHKQLLSSYTFTNIGVRTTCTRPKLPLPAPRISSVMRVIPPCPADSIGFTPSPDSTEHRRKEGCLSTLSSHQTEPTRQSTSQMPTWAEIAPLSHALLRCLMNLEGWLTSYYLHI